MPADRAARRLLLLRHGRTGWNREDRAQGHADVPLDDVGREQAAAVAGALAARSPARLWSSDLARATGTARAISEACGLPVEEDKRLREFSVGERQGLTWEESMARFPWIRRDAGLGASLLGVPGAESDADVTARFVPALQECLAALRPGQLGVVVTHGAALRVGLARLLGWDDSVVGRLEPLDNCHWATVVVASQATPVRLAAYGVGITHN